MRAPLRDMVRFVDNRHVEGHRKHQLPIWGILAARAMAMINLGAARTR